MKKKVLRRLLELRYAKNVVKVVPFYEHIEHPPVATVVATKEAKPKGRKKKEDK